MQFIKEHFIGIAVSIIILISVLLFSAMLMSPTQDAQKRGFIPCTEELVEDITACGKKINFCMIKSVLKGSSCDLKVIWNGFEDWCLGKQDKPWSNYIFDPEHETEKDYDTEGLKEYLDENQNIEQDMNKLKAIKGDI